MTDGTITVFYSNLRLRTDVRCMILTQSGFRFKLPSWDSPYGKIYTYNVN